MAWIADIFKKKAETLPRYRSFDAAKFGRTDDLKELRNINNDLMGSLETVRARCRHLAVNNPYVIKAIKQFKNNIIGAKGFQLHVQSKNSDGSLDEKSNDAVEAKWHCFNQYGNITVDGSMTGAQLQQFVVENVIRDGEFLAIKHYGNEFEHGFALEIVPLEQFPSMFIGENQLNGNLIFQSVEVNQWGKPVAIWITKQTKELQRSLLQGYDSYKPDIRIPIEDVYHVFEKHYPSQFRGIPELVSAVLPLHHLQQYSLSELKQARLASANKLFFTAPTDPEGMSGEDIEQMSKINTDMADASAQILPAGVTPIAISYDSPNANMPDFVKVQLKSVSSGLCLSYASIANDLENINFSSSKYAHIEDQNEFSVRQEFYITTLWERVYRDWLMVQLSNNSIKLPYSKQEPIAKFESLSQVKFMPAGFRNANSNEQMRALALMYAHQCISLSEICAEFGRDFDSVVEQITRENTKLEKLGIRIPSMIELLKLDAMTEMQSQNQDEVSPSKKTGQ